MRYSEEGQSIWYGTGDAPGPQGRVIAGGVGGSGQIGLTIGMQPPSASNSVQVTYRVNGGASETVAAALWAHDPHQQAQYFRAQLPAAHAGDVVEYRVVGRSPGHQVPGPQADGQFQSSFEVVADASVGLRRTPLALMLHPAASGAAVGVGAGSATRPGASRVLDAAHNGVSVAAAAGLVGELALPVHAAPGAMRAGGTPAGGLTPVTEPMLQVQFPSPLLRMPSTIDPLSDAGVRVADTFLPRRTAAVSSFYLGIDRVRLHLGRIATALSARPLPTCLIGVLQQPDGTAGSWLQIQFDPSSVGSRGPKVIALSEHDGRFTLRFPQGMVLPDSGLPLVVHGGNGNVALSIPSSQITANVVVGPVMLASALAPLHVSIIEALTAFLPKEQSSSQSPTKSTGQLHVVKLGEDDACQLSFKANSAVDKFPYGVFFRLIEPQTSIPHLTVQVPGPGGRYFPLPHYPGGAVPTAPGSVSYADRVPIEQPLSVDGFRDQLMGVGAAGIVSPEETVPMAGTLGLGYTLWMSQRWTFQGLALGDLVYSLALAPGEQQQVAIFERVDTAAVTESEFFSEEEQKDEAAKSDTSTQATFSSAFNEMVNGGSQFSSQASSVSNASQGSFSIGIISAGGSGSSGTSDNSGSNTQWLQGQRNTTQQAAESTHSAAESHAAARRSAMRTGMRMATASESESVTTRVITNHNHTRALTLQYWEVLRLYDVTTAVDGLSLTCLIPMQVVRFLPPGQPLTLALADPRLVSSRALVMTRYGSIIKHADVLAQALPRRFQYGLTLLQQFAADPTATVDPFGGAAQDVIQFRLEGTFLPCEDVYITAVTKRNTRVGPVRLTNAAQIPANRYSSREELLAALRSDRHANMKTLMASLALPASLNRNDVVGFEFSRRFRTIDYTLIAPEIAAVNVLQALFPNAPPSWLNVGPLKIGEADANVLTRSTIHLAPSELESELGGPLLRHFQAAIQELDAQGSPTPEGQDETFVRGETYANDSLNGMELPPQPYPIPAIQLGPVLRFNQILEIEKMVQHVVRNTVPYSRAVWASMSPDERAILLEHYTIGVPSNGIADASQMVPLLNCVENRVIGFFGNSMMMPFMIPQAVAEQMGIDPAQLQDNLLAFQHEAFVSPQSTIALPTRGVLGEAVLGHCSSAEKIDLTRFWNWADAPADTAPAISPVTLPTTTPSIAAGLTAPNSLTNLPPLINNVLTAPTPDTSLLQALSKAAASQQDFSPDFTGAKQLSDLISNTQKTANDARASALQENSKVLSKAIDASTEIIKQAIQSYAQTSQSSAKQDTPQAKPGQQPSTGKTPSTNQPSSPGSTPSPGTKPPTGADGSQPASSPDEWQPYPGTGTGGSDALSAPPLVSADTTPAAGANSDGTAQLPGDSTTGISPPPLVTADTAQPTSGSQEGEPFSIVGMALNTILGATSGDGGTSSAGVATDTVRLDSPMYGEASASRIPLAFTPDQKLQTCLTNLIKARPEFTRLRVALVDLTNVNVGDPARYAQFQDELSTPIDSIAKLAPMYAAYQLRHDLRAYLDSTRATITDSLSLQNGFCDFLKSAKSSSVQAIASKPPKFDQIFNLEDFSAIQPLVFKPEFGNELRPGDLQHMIQQSDDIAASRCIAYLGFEWINALLQQSGLASLSSDGAPNGFYLGRLYWDLKKVNGSDEYLTNYPYYWHASRMTNTQYASAKAIAQLLTLLASNRLVDKYSSGEMWNLMIDRNISYFGKGLDAKLGTRAPFIRTKVGYLPKENRAGDCAIVARQARDGNGVLYVAVGLGAKFESAGRNSVLEKLIQELDDCIVDRNGLKD